VSIATPLAEPASTFTSRWTVDSILGLYARPFMDLLLEAHLVYRQHFPDLDMQLSTLLTIKVGGCPEDCHYCPQAARYHTGVKAKKLLSPTVVVQAAKAAQAAGATRYCMGAAWRELKDRDLPKVIELVRQVKDLGMETCMTLGMLTEAQAEALQAAGLDYYNHNLDTSPEFYGEIITTRTYEERLTTLRHVANAGMKVCCGGILGLGESRQDRAGMLAVLATMSPQPQSVPINHLMPVKGTPLGEMPPLDPFEFVRTIAIARILIPKARVRLSAGRANMSDELQALCFFAGANSIFYGDKLFMTENPALAHDQALLNSLGITCQKAQR